MPREESSADVLGHALGNMVRITRAAREVVSSAEPKTDMGQTVDGPQSSTDPDWMVVPKKQIKTLERELAYLDRLSERR